MKLEVVKDRLEINKIIENCLPLMVKNKNMTQECADCIVLYFIEKSSEKCRITNNQQIKKIEDTPNPRLETRSKAEEDNTDDKTVDVDNQSADNIHPTKPSMQMDSEDVLNDGGNCSASPVEVKTGDFNSENAEKANVEVVNGKM